MTKKQIIIFNGPPSCGKDTAAEIVFNKLSGLSYRYKMALPLKEACHKLLGLQGTLEQLEAVKEKPIQFIVKDSYDGWENKKLVNDAGLMTLRQFYIHLSENIMKPMFGEDIFGRLAVENLKQTRQSVITISDGGFFHEVQPIINYFGADRCCLVKIKRPGTDFSNDSRSYIDLDIPNVFEIENNGSQQEFANALWSLLLEKFLNIGEV